MNICPQFRELKAYVEAPLYDIQRATLVHQTQYFILKPLEASLILNALILSCRHALLWFFNVLLLPEDTMPGTVL